MVPRIPIFAESRDQFSGDHAEAHIVANEETEMLSPALFRGEAGRGAPPYVKSNIALNIGGIYWVHSRDGTNKRN